MELRKTMKVRFDLNMDEQMRNGYNTNDVTHVLKVQTHEENGMMDRNRKPQGHVPTNRQYQHAYTTAPSSTGGSSQSSSNGYVHANSNVEAKYISMVNGLRDEMSFLEESNSNLLVELRESQDANYVLTEEMRRLQRSNINMLDELQACQTANTVLRQELQRLEQNSVKMTKETDRYKKANKMLKEEMKDIKSTHYKRKTSIQMIREKAKDLQNDLIEKEKSYQELAVLKQSINVIVDTVEAEHFDTDNNGYYPTDSDTLSTEGNDETLEPFKPKPVYRERGDRITTPLSSSSLNRRLVQQRGTITTDYKQEQNGLFGKRYKDLYSDIEEQTTLSSSFNGRKSIDDDNPQTPITNRIQGRRRGSSEILEKRRGSSENVEKRRGLSESGLHKEILTQNAERKNGLNNSSLSYKSLTNLSAENHTKRSNTKLDLNGNLEEKGTSIASKKFMCLQYNELSPSNTWEL